MFVVAVNEAYQRLYTQGRHANICMPTLTSVNAASNFASRYGIISGNAIIAYE